MEDEYTIQLKANPGACKEVPDVKVDPVKSVQEKVSTRHSKLTKAERNYRINVFYALFMTILILFLIAFIVTGAASMYVIKVLSVEPNRSYIIYETANKLKNTSNIKEQFDILVNGVKTFRSVSKVSGGGKLRTIRERNRINEKAANSGI